jgi:hypothetical protein
MVASTMDVQGSRGGRPRTAAALNPTAGGSAGALGEAGVVVGVAPPADWHVLLGALALLGCSSES